MSKCFLRHYSTRAIIAMIEDGQQDVFLYSDMIDELKHRTKDRNDLLAFQFLVQQDLPSLAIGE